LSGKNRKVIKSVKRAKKIKLGEGGTRTYATAMKRSSALNNFMIEVTRLFTPVNFNGMTGRALAVILKLNF
jgi:hypothetical protein